ncbi:MAG TPA: glycosyltransferase, partial [Candidatus Paceibacterota bacterium]|nr:glycosyltransferase [Candidatus Paceibacterota bacterium]
MVPSLSIVIPVYNSEDSLPLLLERLQTVLPQLTDRYEAVLVNDGSRDHSWERIQELQAQYPWMRGICLMRNYGQHNALLCGIRA